MLNGYLTLGPEAAQRFIKVLTRADVSYEDLEDARNKLLKAEVEEIVAAAYDHYTHENLGQRGLVKIHLVRVSDELPTKIALTLESHWSDETSLMRENYEVRIKHAIEDSLLDLLGPGIAERGLRDIQINVVTLGRR